MLFPTNLWQDRNPLAQGLRPLAALFCWSGQLRRAFYRNAWLKQKRLPVPVIIVGNISVGGTGKTPLVIWLARHCQNCGWHPGVITRGFGGCIRHSPQLVDSHSDPSTVGDEAVLLARRCGCPIAAGANRHAAGQLLLQKTACNLIICDDGLQHYQLQRDVEIAVIDGQRHLGNGWCLPAGPLRESARRLLDCDVVVVNGPAQSTEISMTLQANQIVSLSNPPQIKSLTELRNQHVTAIAGIGNPQRFFTMLRNHGLHVTATAFPDHYAFKPQNFTALQQRPLLMTEKDAVKCERFLNDTNIWYVPVEVVVESKLIAKIDSLLLNFRTLNF